MRPPGDERLPCDAQAFEACGGPRLDQDQLTAGVLPPMLERGELPVVPQLAENVGRDNQIARPIRHLSGISQGPYGLGHNARHRAPNEPGSERSHVGLVLDKFRVP